MKLFNLDLLSRLKKNRNINTINNPLRYVC